MQPSFFCKWKCYSIAETAQLNAWHFFQPMDCFKWRVVGDRPGSSPPLSTMWINAGNKRNDEVSRTRKTPCYLSLHNLLSTCYSPMGGDSVPKERDNLIFCVSLAFCPPFPLFLMMDAVLPHTLDPAKKTLIQTDTHSYRIYHIAISTIPPKGLGMHTWSYPILLSKAPCEVRQAEKLPCPRPLAVLTASCHFKALLLLGLRRLKCQKKKRKEGIKCKLLWEPNHVHCVQFL